MYVCLCRDASFYHLLCFFCFIVFVIVFAGALFFPFFSLASLICPHPSDTRLHLLLHRPEKDGISAGAQHADRRRAVVCRPDGIRSFLYSAFGGHWNDVLHPGGKLRSLISQKKHGNRKRVMVKNYLPTSSPSFCPQLGAESGIDNPNLRAMKTVFRIMPLVIFPLTINFPTVSKSFAHICYCSHIVKKTSLKYPFFFLQTSGSLYLLADLKLLLPVSSGSAQTPLNQKKVEDSWKDQAPGLRSATERRIDRKHEKGLVSRA